MTQKAILTRAITQAPAPERARRGFDQLLQTNGARAGRELSSEQARILAALFSGSPALGNLLLAHPLWLDTLLSPENLHHARQEQGLRREVEAWLRPAWRARDYANAFSKLRQFKQEEMARIAARDLARLGNGPEITREISNVADVCLGAVLQLCWQQLAERFGQPYHQDPEQGWHATGFGIIGLGKLGGQELNYSSDVDVIFVYAEEGTVFKAPPGKAKPPAHAMSNHQFFKRLAEAFIAEVTRQTPEGFLFRIDLRLRPEGDAGPLVRSLSSYENYYAQWGQTWERMMLIKARGIAGDAALGAEFLDLVQPFRYPRSLSEGFPSEIASIKARIETEVLKTGEIDRNVKLGRGGIREIEFVAQTLQLLHAGRIPFLQGAQTLPALQKLKEYDLLSGAEVQALSAAYCFLRDVEHRLQMENNLQTHTIPTGLKARERLAALMGCSRLGEFESALKKHTGQVRHVYDKLLKAETSEANPAFPGQFQGAEKEWQSLLAEHSFRDVEKSLRLLKEFAHGPGYVHVSPRTVELAWQLLSKIFALCPKQIAGNPDQQTGHSPGKDQFKPATSTNAAHGPNSRVLSDPDRVVARLDSFITAYGSRAMLFETWASNPSLFELLLLLFDRSEFLAETAIRTPDLVDDLVLSGRLRRRKTMEETLGDLRHGRADTDQRLWLRRYHQAELMRIGLRGILGLTDLEQNLTELSCLADACLNYALEIVLRKNNLKKPPFVVIGLGKLGGKEITYGSDLDIIFVARDKTKNLPRLQRLAVEFMDLLSSVTEMGVAFVMDARLRPDGEKGLLVNNLSAYEEYYRGRAQLWEIQSLTRTRPVAGDLALGARFQQMAAVLTDFRPQNVAANFARRPPSPEPPSSRSASAHYFPRKDQSRLTSAATVQRLDARNFVAGDSRPEGPIIGLAAYTPDWKKVIARMRRRIEKERTPPGRDGLAIKTGSGGLMDAEFIAQTLCLANGWQEANTLNALRRGQQTKGLNPAEADLLLQNYRELQRVEGVLRRWSFEGETVLPTDPRPLYRVAIRCGFASPETFLQAIVGYRDAIRSVYSKVMEESRS